LKAHKIDRDCIVGRPRDEVPPFLSIQFCIYTQSNVQYVDKISKVEMYATNLLHDYSGQKNEEKLQAYMECILTGCGAGVLKHNPQTIAIIFTLRCLTQH
jgi:hypothetical protein